MQWTDRDIEQLKHTAVDFASLVVWIAAVIAACFAFAPAPPA